MNARLARCLARLYPREWRARYGDEFAALLEEEPGSPIAVLNVIRCGLGESAARFCRGRAALAPRASSSKAKVAMNLGCALALILAFAIVAKAMPLLALCRTKDGFVAWSGDARIRCEPGAEKLAAAVAAALPSAVAAVERGRCRRLDEPIVVYVCATVQSAARHGGTPGAAGFVLKRRLFISPAFENSSQSLAGLLTGELSRLQIEREPGPAAGESVEMEAARYARSFHFPRE